MYLECNPEWHCKQCKKRHCYVCREISGTTCEHLRKLDLERKADKDRQREIARQALAERSRKVLENETATQRKIAETCKRCPKTRCGNKIERKDGCAHFTCNLCQTQFCFSCKVIWRGKPLHLDTCRVGTTSTVSRARLDTSGYASGWDKDPGYDISLDKNLWLVTGDR